MTRNSSRYFLLPQLRIRNLALNIRIKLSLEFHNNVASLRKELERLLSTINNGRKQLSRASSFYGGPVVAANHARDGQKSVPSQNSSTQKNKYDEHHYLFQRYFKNVPFLSFYGAMIYLNLMKPNNILLLLKEKN